MVGLDERPFFHYGLCMSKMAKNPGSAPEELRFEEALKQLETIVEAMESGDLPLETMLSRFEEGVKLSRHCQAKLDEAEVTIQQLEKNADGELTLKPLDETNPAA